MKHYNTFFDEYLKRPIIKYEKGKTIDFILKANCEQKKFHRNEDSFELIESKFNETLKENPDFQFNYSIAHDSFYFTDEPVVKCMIILYNMKTLTPMITFEQLISNEDIIPVFTGEKK